MRWRWWLTPRNPRFVYMLAGSCFASGGICFLANALAGRWFIAAVAIAPLALGIEVVRLQERRDNAQGSAWAKHQNAEFDRMCDTAMRTIASRINDDLEKAGHGRPVHVQEVSVH